MESLVWDREKEIDRFRERFQLTRALLQVKEATLKNPTRNFTTSLQSLKGASLVPIIVELSKDSLYNGEI